MNANTLDADSAQYRKVIIRLMYNLSSELWSRTEGRGVD